MVLQSGLWRLLRAVGTAKVRSTGMRRTAPGSVISLGWRPDGTRIRRKVTARTKTEVRDKLEKLQAGTDAGLKTSASYTVAKAWALLVRGRSCLTSGSGCGGTGPGGTWS